MAAVLGVCWVSWAMMLSLMTVPPPGLVLPISMAQPRGLPLMSRLPMNTLPLTRPLTPPGVIGEPFTRPKDRPIGLLRNRLFSMMPPERACTPWLEELAMMLPRITTLLHDSLIYMPCLKIVGTLP